MIQNNNIRNEPCSFYFSEQFLFETDRFENYTDALVQIKNEKSRDYKLKFRDKFIRIDQNGTLEEYPKGLMDKSTDNLMKLI